MENLDFRKRKQVFRKIIVSAISDLKFPVRHKNFENIRSMVENKRLTIWIFETVSNFLEKS